MSTNDPLYKRFAEYLKDPALRADDTLLLQMLEEENKATLYVLLETLYQDQEILIEENQLTKEAIYNKLLQEVQNQHINLSKTDTQASQVIQPNVTHTSYPTPAAISAFNHKKFIGIAATVLLILGIGWLMFSPKKTNQHSPEINMAASSTEKLPAGIMLTLTNGKEVLLDTLAEGAIYGNEHFNKEENGLHYLSGNKNNLFGKHEIEYHTLSVPRGKQYFLVLSDGTKVWLNAESSITYPIAFNANTRNIDVSGEVFIDVHPAKNQPFIVNIGSSMALEVLGTSFNIKAYSNEAKITTTLISGAVRLSSNNKVLSQLTPGEQGVLTLPIISTGITSSQADYKILKKMDIEKVTAWKSGVFDFDNVQLEESMREIARWYNIEIEFENKVPDIVFGGKLTRDLPFTEMLGALKDAHVNFKYDKQKQKLIIYDK